MNTKDSMTISRAQYDMEATDVMGDEAEDEGVATVMSK